MLGRIQLGVDQLQVKPLTHMARRVQLRWAVVLLGVSTALVVLAIATAPRWRPFYYGGAPHHGAPAPSQTLLTPQGHSRWVNGGAFSPPGHRLRSPRWDGAPPAK